VSHTDNTEVPNPYAPVERKQYNKFVKTQARLNNRSLRHRVKTRLRKMRFDFEQEMNFGGENRILSSALGRL